MIENIGELINNRRKKRSGKHDKIAIIGNYPADIEKAKAKVQKIIESGELKRRKVKKRKKKEE